VNRSRACTNAFSAAKPADFHTGLLKLPHPIRLRIDRVRSPRPDSAGHEDASLMARVVRALHRIEGTDPRRLSMHVKELMSHPVVTCTTEDHLDVPARLMWEFDCGVIPVVDHEGRLAGVVTDRDVCMAAYTQGRILSEIVVTTAMASNVLVCHPDEDILAAEQLMREGRVRRIPVIDAAGRPEGIVSLNDFARATARGRKSGVDRELVATMAAICEPRRQVGDAHVSARPVLTTVP
jgi:CBS domain-containing protein